MAIDLTGAGAGAAARAGGDVRGARRSSWCRCCWCRWRRAPASSRGAGAGPASRRPALTLLGGEALLLLDNQARVQRLQGDLRAAAHAGCAAWSASVLSPRGDYLLLDDFTERVDTDISNNAGMLGVPGRRRPSACIATATGSPHCPSRARSMSGYAAAALDALPYRADPARQRAAGRRLGRLPHRRSAGARRRAGARAGAGAGAAAARCSRAGSVAGLARPIRVSASPARARWRRCAARGTTTSSICRPTSSMPPRPTRQRSPCRRSPAICARWRRAASCPSRSRSATFRSMRCACSAPPARRCWQPASPIRRRISWCYRSAWGVRILLSNRPWDAARIAAVRQFCDERSFDVSWYPGHRLRGRARQHLQRPAGGFVRQRRGRPPTGPDDAIADEAGAVLAGTADAVARRIQPGADHAGPAVLLRRAAAGSARHDPEAAGDPAAGGDRRAGQSGRAGAGGGDRRAGAAGAAGRAAAGCACRRSGVLRPIVYFPALGLGFLFIEIFLIEKASFWLNDRTSGFALVLTGMLVFSGLGSMLADRLAAAPRRGIALACLVIVAWCAAVLLGLQPAILGDARAALAGARGARPGGAGAGVAGAGPAVPAGPGADRVGRVAALGLGTERRILRGGDATRQPDRARSRVQPGSAVRRGVVCDCPGDVSGRRGRARAWQLHSARSRAAE